MLIGYVRISTDDQLLGLQRDAMAKAGCERVFEDTASGAKADRIGLAALLANLRRGDTVVVWRLDRLGRSIKDLIYLVEQLEDAGVGLKSLQENIDTTPMGGRLVFHLFAALAEFERNLIRERTHAGLSAARARGRLGGRKKASGSRQAQSRPEALSRAPIHRGGDLPDDGNRSLDALQLHHRGRTGCPPAGVRPFPSIRCCNCGSAWITCRRRARSGPVRWPL